MNPSDLRNHLSSLPGQIKKLPQARSQSGTITLLLDRYEIIRDQAPSVSLCNHLRLHY